MAPAARCLARLTLLALSIASFAHAAPRTFVSTAGNDANACTLSAPCRGFSKAITVTDVGGEIVVLDSGGYGAVTIAKTVSIVAPAGVYAGISVFSGDGIAVNGANIKVVLRGLTINGQGGVNGIAISNAGVVHVEGCVVTNMTGTGIYQTAGTLFVKDTIVRGSALYGVWVLGVNAKAALDRVRLEANFDGVRAQNGARVSVQDSVMSGNANAGAVSYLAGGTATTSVSVTRSLLTLNQRGAHGQCDGANAFAVMHLTENTITDNADGLVLLSANAGCRVNIRAVRNQITLNQIGVHLPDGFTFVELDGNYVYHNSVQDVITQGAQIATGNNNVGGVAPFSVSGNLPTF